MIKEIIEMYRMRNQKNLKEAMCRNVINRGACPKSCKECQWYTGKTGGTHDDR